MTGESRASRYWGCWPCSQRRVLGWDTGDAVAMTEGMQLWSRDLYRWLPVMSLAGTTGTAGAESTGPPH